MITDNGHVEWDDNIPNLVIYFVQDIVLKNAESWAKLVRQSITATAIKSSKESFKQFRKVAQKKEEVEKALKKKQTEDNKEREAPEKSRYLENALDLSLHFFFTRKRIPLRQTLKESKTTFLT